MTDGVRDWESKCVGAEGAEEVSVGCGTQLGGVGICIGNDSVGAEGLRNGSVQGNVVLDGGHEVSIRVGYRECSLDLAPGNGLLIQSLGMPGGAGAGLAGVIRGRPSQATSLQQAPGAAPGEVCAKLELFLWLGLGKQAKACTSELPLDLLPEPSVGLPHHLYRDGEYRAQLNICQRCGARCSAGAGGRGLESGSPVVP